MAREEEVRDRSAAVCGDAMLRKADLAELARTKPAFKWLVRILGNIAVVITPASVPLDRER